MGRTTLAGRQRPRDTHTHRCRGQHLQANRHDTDRLNELEERQTAREARRGEAIDEARVPSARRGARLCHHRVEVAGRHVPKNPDAAGGGGVDGCTKVVL